MHDKPKRKDIEQFVIDTVEKKIKCTYCDGWNWLKSIKHGEHVVFSVEQVEKNFKAKHIKSCKK